MRLAVLLLLILPNVAFAAFSTTVTKEDVQTKYLWAGQGGDKVHILIMPGHEPFYGGAEHAGLRERDIVVDISNKLATHLRANPNYEVTIARDQLNWSAELQEYFEEEWEEIKDFVEDSKRVMKRMIRKGDIEDRDFEVEHNSAATDVALRLYGINKWASEEGYDIVIHPHLNDNMGAEFQSGFAVYVPDAQFGNGQAGHALGEAIAFELNDMNASSTLPIENYAIVEDQDLIALGAYNTADFPVVLVEYAYIYESKIANAGARDAVLSDMAYQTYRGIQNFVGAPVAGDNTLALPYAWTQAPLLEGESSPQVYALQVALHSLGLYPLGGQLLIGCPVSGYMGPCTRSALKVFQASKGLEQTGTIGPRTKAALVGAGF
ncbi:N-acetylmuramoyl-L-alanine amidase [Candidatus Parcubacteria bacterium]|nr:N-acetylmuramoyl-L-alanine amidase [Candidatus Parcubacteria bacterium]